MLFLTSEFKFTRYVDSNTPYAASDNVYDAITLLENDPIWLSKWFSDKQMKTNKDKYHFNVSNNEHVFIKMDDMEFESSYHEKLLEIKC